MQMINAFERTLHSSFALFRRRTLFYNNSNVIKINYKHMENLKKIIAKIVSIKTKHQIVESFSQFI